MRFQAFLFCLLGSLAIAKGPSSGSDQILENTLSKYRSASYVQMNVVKTSKSEIMDKTTTFKGKIFLSSHAFRWDNEEPEKTQLIFDGKTIWNVQYPPKNMKAAIQVAKAKVDKNSRKQLLLSLLLDKSSFTKNFRPSKPETTGDGVKVKLDPLSTELSLSELSLFIDPKARELQKVSYKDDVGNLTQLEFAEISFKKTPIKGLFNYSPPAGAQVTDL